MSAQTAHASFLRNETPQHSALRKQVQRVSNAPEALAFVKQIADGLVAFRMRLGLSPKDMASLLPGVTKADLYIWEKGVRSS